MYSLLLYLADEYSPGICVTITEEYKNKLDNRIEESFKWNDYGEFEFLEPRDIVKFKLNGDI